MKYRGNDRSRQNGPNCIFHPNMKEHTFFSVACGSFSKIVHTLRYKENLNKLRKIWIILCIPFGHNRIRPLFRSKRNLRKHKTLWRLNQILNIESLKTSRKNKDRILKENENIFLCKSYIFKAAGLLNFWVID